MTEIYGQNTEPDARDGDAPGDRVVVGVRVGGHPDQRFDRVVVDLTGGGEPGWWVGYTDGAYRQGSGDEVDVPGEAVLTMVVRGTTYADEGTAEYDGAPVDGPGTAVLGVRFDGTFEGQTQLFLGTASRLPFRVGTVGSPSRVYVDVVHPA